MPHPIRALILSMAVITACDAGSGGSGPGSGDAAGPDATGTPGDARARDTGPDTVSADAARPFDTGPPADATPSADGRPPADGPTFEDAAGPPPDVAADARLADAASPDDAAAPPPDLAPPPPDGPPTCLPPEPWSRSARRAGGTVTFNELAFSEGEGDDAAEWLELHNQLAIDVDLSGWFLNGDVEHLFPEGTFLPAGGYLTLGPDTYRGALDPQQTLLELHNNTGRLMDRMEVDQTPAWPRLPPGHTLAKTHPDRASAPGESWAPSPAPGGTPGADNATADTPPPPATESPVVIHEIMYHPPDDASAVEYIELHNKSAEPVDLSGWQLVDAVEHTFREGTILAPGGFAVVADDALAFAAAYPDVPLAGAFNGGLANGGERIALTDACGALQDEVRYFDGGRWPGEADGGGSSLELRDPRADNTGPQTWAASDESANAAWERITYRAAAAPSPVGPDGQWEELVVGLLDAGVVLLDDLRVIEDPDGAAVDLLQNGTFDDGTTRAWRFLGTHERAEIVPDPDDPANPVLRLTATGPTEHMHNHAETTLADGRRVTNGTTYEISFRARWVSGGAQLNTRLYFNRLARTTRLARPLHGGTPGAPNGTHTDNLGPTLDGLQHSPVVPPPMAPVTVIVRAGDPDGVARVTLLAATDGAPFEATPMAPTENASEYTAVLPGQPAGTQLHFYVEAEDTRGAVAHAPMRGPDARALLRFDDGLANPNGLHNLRILMTRADNDRFHAETNLMSNASTGATVIYDEEQVFYDVGVRAKGSERGRPVQARLGFSVRFGPENPLRGVYETVSIDRSEGVHFGQREMLMDQVMAHAGAVHAEYNDLLHLIAPRVEHTGAASLQATRFSDLMLDTQFEDGADGLLYEYELIYYPLTTDDGTPEGRKRPQPDGVVGTWIRDLGPDPEAWRYDFLPKTNRARDDFSGAMALGRLFSLPEPDFVAQAESVLDVDQWLRAFAFMATSGSIDHYGSGAQHNTQLYQRPEDGRMLLFPHDLDFYPGDPHQAVVANGDLGRLLNIPGNRRRFYGHLKDILDSTYNDEYMARWRDQFAALLPAQPFDAHHRFLVERARWLAQDAPDSLRHGFPEVPFALTTAGGDPFDTPEAEVVLEGTGWLDVHDILMALQGVPVPAQHTWTGDQTWALTVPLDPGENEVELLAMDRQGNAVGVASTVITRLE